MFKLTVDPRKAPDDPEDFSIVFEKGIPVKLTYTENSATKSVKSVKDPLELFLTANTIARRHGKTQDLASSASLLIILSVLQVLGVLISLR